MSRTQWESFALILIALIFLVCLCFSLFQERTYIRDDLRQQDISQLKRALEDYYNKHEFYITSPTTQIGCTTSIDPKSWFFGNSSPLLHEKLSTALPHDVRENKGFLYQYCITDIQNSHTTGYYLQAQLEGKKYNEKIDFDEDEHRKYDYRIMKDHGRILYRVCGGTEIQCQS